MAPSRSRISELLQSSFGGSKTRRRRKNPETAQGTEHLEERALLSATSHDDGSILVGGKDGVTADQLAGELNNVSVRAVGDYGVFHVVLPAGTTVEEAIQTYDASPNTRFAEPNYHYFKAFTPDDPQFVDMYHLNNTGQTGGTVDADVDAVEGWDTSTDASTIVVAVIDSGTDIDHEDLQANIWVNADEIPGDGIDNDNNGYIDDVNGWDFNNQDNDPSDDEPSSHGTHVGGTIGAVGNNAIGVTGVAHTVQLMPLRIFAPGTTTDIIIEAINYSVDNGASVSNNSWGGGPFSQALFDAIDNARVNDQLFVAASGNHGGNNDAFAYYPASYDLDNIVAVGASDHNDSLANFSGFGATTVDLAAPGVDILSTYEDNTYGLNTGTSMATPVVSGAAALLRQADPTASFADIKSALLAGVDVMPDFVGTTVSGGRLNLAGSFAALSGLQVNVFADSIREDAGANATLASVSRFGDVSADLTVTLSSSDTTEATVQGSVTIPAGSRRAFFSVSAVDDNLLDGTQTVAIIASAPGRGDGSDVVDVEDVESLALTIDPGSIFENAGANAATGTLTRSNEDLDAPGFLVSTANGVIAYDNNGGVVDSFDIEYPGGTRPGDQPARDLIITQSGDIAVYNGVDGAFSSFYDNGSQTWTHETLTGLGTDASIASSGGIASYKNFVFMADMDTTNGQPRGIVRFDTLTGQSLRFGNRILGDRLFGTISTLDFDELVDIDPLSGAILNDFSSPEGRTLWDGMAYDGSSLWYLGGINARIIYQMDPETGAIIDQFDTGLTTGLDGIASLGDELYLLDAFIENRIVVWSKSTQQILRIMDIPESISGGLTAATGPDRLYVTDTFDEVIYELDPQTGVITSSFEHTRGSSVLGLATVNNELYVSGHVGQEIQVYTRTGTLLRTIDVPTSIGTGSLAGDDVQGPVASPYEYSDLAMGLDGLLYGLDQDGNILYGYDPDTLETERILDLQADATAVAVDSFGTVFGVRNNTFIRYNQDGSIDQILSTAVSNLIDLDIALNGTLLAGSASGTVVRLDSDFALPPTEFNTGAAAAFVSFAVAPGSASGDIVVTIANSDPSEISAPQTVILPAGAQSVSFPIDAVDDRLFDGTQTATLTPTAPGYDDATGDSIDVLDYESINIDVDRDEIKETDGPDAARILIERSNIDGPFDFTTSRTSANSDDLTILDEDTVISTVDIPAETAFVSDVNVYLELEHGHLGDLDVYLISPAGTRVELFTDVGANGTLMSGLTLDDQAASPITSGSDPFVGSYQPEQSLSDLNGEVISGTWTLEITDDTNLSSGTLLEWSLEVGSVGFAPIEVTLVTSDSTEAIPQTTTVTLPANQAALELPLDAIDDSLLDGTQNVTITGSASGYVEGTDNVDVIDFETIQVSVDPGEIAEDAGANAATGTVTRTNESDLSSPLVVTLSNNDTSEISIPATVTIPAGEQSATFPIDAVDDTRLDGRKRVRIDATAPGFAASDESRAFIFVLDSEPVLNLTISQEEVFENDRFVTATLSRTNYTSLSNSLSVGLTSTRPADVTVPPSITIPAGEESVDFTITLTDNDILDGDRDITIRAEGGGTFPGEASLTVNDFETLSLEFSPAEFTEFKGARASEVTITRNNTDVDDPLDVALTSSDLTELEVPGTVTIPAGESSTTFFVESINDDDFDGAQLVEVTAISGGYVTETQTVTVFDHEPTTIIGPEGEITDPQPELTWEGVEGATRYHVRVDNLSTGETFIIDEDDIPSDVTSYTPEILLGISNFRFRVRWQDALERWQPWSKGAKIKVRTAPEIVSPTAVPAENPPTLAWTAIVDAERYQLDVDDLTRNRDGIIDERDLTTTSFTPESLEPGDYEMSVRAIGPNGIRGNWVRQKFSVLLRPQLLTPNGPAWALREISWSDEGADHYDLRVHEATGETTNLNFIRDRFVVGTSFTLEQELTIGHNYIITVRGFTAEGKAGPWSERVVVRMGAAPTMLTPADGSTTDGFPFFDWNDTLNLKKYDFRVREVGKSGNLIRRRLDNSAYQHDVALESGTTYRAWVRTVSIEGLKSRWSKFVEFTVASSGSVELPEFINTPDEAILAAAEPTAVEADPTEFVEQPPVIVNSYTTELTTGLEPTATPTADDAQPIDAVMEQLPVDESAWWANGEEAPDFTSDDSKPAQEDITPTALAGGTLLGLLLGGRRRSRKREE